MAPPKDLPKLISLVQTTQTLLSHFSASLTPSPSSPTTAQPALTSTDLPTGPLAAISAATTLLKSHTTTLSLLLLTPPLTPSALIAKIGDVTSGPLAGMVAAASYTPAAGAADDVGDLMRAEVRTHVQRLVGAWGDVLAVVLAMAGARQKGEGSGVSEGERSEVLGKTGVVWDTCDAVVRVCEGGVVGVVVKKAQQLRAVLMDAVEELKEWGEDVADEEEDDDKAEGSGGEEDGFSDEEDFFAAENKLGKGDVDLKALLDRSVKKLKMVGIMYQAVGKRRLSTFPPPGAKPTATTPKAATNGEPATQGTSKTEPTSEDPSKKTPQQFPAQRLDALMALLKTIPSTADDLASTFYDLDREEAEAELQKLCEQAKSAVQLVVKNWSGAEDEFTAWSTKWTEAIDAA